MSQLIGFCGRKRAGKGVLSEIVKEKYDGVIVTAANYLKYICCELLGYTLEELNERKDNGYVFFLHPSYQWYDTIHKWTGIEIKYIKKEIAGIKFNNVRQVLQVIGTDCIRRYNPSWHVECMVKDIKKYLNEGKTVVVDDVRFPNERKAIEDLGGECYYIVRPLTDNVSNHISETSLTWDMFADDHVIINNNTLDNFKKHFDEHLSINGNSENAHPIFLNEMPYFQKMNNLFGKEKTKLVEKILAQNKDYDLFKDKGVFRFKPSKSSEFAEFIKELYGIKIVDNKRMKHIYYKIYNPLIIENLKRHINEDK